MNPVKAYTIYTGILTAAMLCLPGTACYSKDNVKTTFQSSQEWRPTMTTARTP